MRQQSLWLLASFAFFLSGSAAQQRPASKPSPACGPLDGQSFKCPKFAFTCKVPFGWVDRTDDMQKESQPDDQGHAESGEQAKSEPGKPTTENSGQSEVLLAAFERPPDAPGETINSSVIIASESQSANPKIKTAADYFWSIADLAELHGFKAVGEPYAFTVGGKQLARGDFSGERGKLTIYQSSLVMIEKRQIVSFTFIGGSEDEVEDLIENLKFEVGAQPRQLPHR